ncbi:UMP kinase [Patescibacteria group bacterium]|nr:UMP kinase [Patescibacteria group bacterium]MBU4511920.1 UMP kinase [Patescibacteria group bacterium]MCG2692888.1 UMP kinase [Candidatus Parcubacteria bacterium]
MKTLIISLGGSIIIPAPDKVDVKFLKKFRQLILDYTKRGNRAAIITGGGKINKLYNGFAQKIAKIKPIDLDWLGISFTRANAELVRSIFGDYAYEKIITDPTKKIPARGWSASGGKTNKKIIIGCGWKPGCSSDKDAVLIAKNLGAKTIVNLTNIDYVYTADPRKVKDAKPIKKMTWDEYKKLIGGKWIPRMNSPFDPIAAKLAAKLKLEVAIMKGTNLDNFKKFLGGKKFKGTIIK